MKQGETLKIKYRNVSDLVPYARNARTHSDAQVAEIAASITAFGWTNPILIDEAGELIAGHGRVLAAQLLGLDRAPTITLAGLSDEQKRAYRIADNKLALNSGWDEELLAAELAGLKGAGFDLGVIGFTDDELDDLLNGPAAAPDEGGDGGVGAIPAPIVTQLGDLWLLGAHRLLCGDSTAAEEVQRLTDGAPCDCMWTDPPYNVAYEGAAGSIQNDSMSGADFYAFLKKAFLAAAGALRGGSPVYVAHADSETVNFRNAMVDSGFRLSTGLVWQKNALVLSRGDYHYRHEPILYGWKVGEAHRWYGNRSQTSILELDDPPVQQTGKDEYQIQYGDETLVIRGQGVTVQRMLGTVIMENKPTRSVDHPTMKPVALIERMLANSTKRGQTVLDLFGGGGVYPDRLRGDEASSPVDGIGAEVCRFDCPPLAGTDRQGSGPGRFRHDLRSGGRGTLGGGLK